MCSSSPLISPARQRIILLAQAQAVAVNIGCVETHGGQYIGVHGRTKSQMASHADTDGAQAAGAIVQALDGRAGRAHRCRRTKRALPYLSALPLSEPA